MKNVSMHCTRCGKMFSCSDVAFRCDVCGSPLEIDSSGGSRIEDGNILGQTVLERYGDFYPFDEPGEGISLHEGFTPLVRADRLASNLGIDELYLKNESQNPTWSFKDRGTMCGLRHALELGFRRIGTVSTGNMAASVAAYGAAANLETFILVSGNLPEEKADPIAIYGAHLVRVDGDYGNLYFESLRMGNKLGICFINSDAPFRVEGYKTLAFEICEQTAFDVPDYVIVPTSAGGNIRGIAKGFREFAQCGLVRRIPVMICAQAGGCSPIVDAWKRGDGEISRVADPHTLAHAIENPFPPSGTEVLKMLRTNGGICVSVDDGEIVQAQGILARHGVFVQPASAVSIAAVRRLRRSGYLDGKSRVACVLTGGGLKYTAALREHSLKASRCSIDDLENVIGGLLK